MADESPQSKEINMTKQLVLMTRNTKQLPYKEQLKILALSILASQEWKEKEEKWWRSIELSGMDGGGE